MVSWRRSIVRVAAAVAAAASSSVVAASSSLLPASAFEVVASPGDVFDGVTMSGYQPSVDVNNNGQWIASYGTLVNGLATFGLVGNTGMITTPGQFFDDGGGMATMSTTLADLRINNLRQYSVSRWFKTSQGQIHRSVLIDGVFALKPGDPVSFDPPSTYPNETGFMDFNDAGQALVATQLAFDPDLQNNTLVMVSPDGSGGYIDTPLAVPGAAIPAGTLGWVNASQKSGFALSASGSFAYGGEYIKPGGATVDAIFVDGEIVAADGLASPLEGFDYQLSAGPVAVGNHGHYAFRSTLSNGTSVTSAIFVDTTVAVTAAGLGIPGITSVPALKGLALDDSLNVFWMGAWQDPQLGLVDGIFQNETLLVQSGDSEIGGQLLTDIVHWSVSDNGKWLAFLGEFEDGSRHVVRVAVPAPGAAAGVGAVCVGAVVGRRRRAG